MCELTKEQKVRIWERDGYRCKYCGRKVIDYNLPGSPLPDDAATIDHVLAKSNGGTNDHNNLVTACHECNHELGNKFTTYGEKVNYINMAEKQEQQIKRWERRMYIIERRRICAYF